MKRCIGFRHMALVMSVFVGLQACGDDSLGPSGDAQQETCGEDEVVNPIHGECQAAHDHNMAQNRDDHGASNGMMDGNSAPAPSNMRPGNQAPNSSPVGQNTDPGNNAMVVAPSGPVDPSCVDGQYAEALPNATVDLSAEEMLYSPTNTRQFVYDVLQKRYPFGRFLAERAPTTHFDCVDAFIHNPGSASGVLDSLSTVVHECGHIYDLDRGGFEGAHYAITETLSFTCQGGDTTERFGNTFARSRIRDDQFSIKRPYCESGQGCDFYSGTYLDGDPDDSNFDSGDQGYNSVLEEATQYVNSLAIGYAFQDYYAGGTSERDGILTFLWYIGRYLHMARTQYPSAYEAIVSDSCWRQATLTVWGRAWLYLDATKDIPQLGIDDDEIEALVMDPIILNEIQLLRDREGCGG